MTKQRNFVKKYDISNRRYFELLNFCLQYPEWCKELLYDTDTVKSPVISGMPHSETNVTGDPTRELAIRRVELSKKCELIEQIAIECHEEDYPFLIWNVTQQGASYNFMYDYSIMNGKEMPKCSRGEFYNIRRMFFFLLDKKR
jgi:hypothetical protein